MYVTHHFPLFSPSVETEDKPSAGTATAETPRIKDKPVIFRLPNSDEEGQPEPKRSKEKWVFIILINIISECR